MEIHGTDHIEFYVGNAKQAAWYYQKAFGFAFIAYAGPENGVRDRASYVMAQNKVRFVLTTGLSPDHEAVTHQARHGDGVKVVALWVEDAETAYRIATARGATGLREPYEIADEHGTARLATIATYGDTVHTFVERNDYRGAFLPGYGAAQWFQPQPVGLEFIDHTVANVGDGDMGKWQDFYQRIFGFHQFAHFDEKDVSTEHSALRSVVMANHNERVKFPINEPAEGKRKSQIQEYVEAYRSPGVQHIALDTRDIITTVEALRANGVEFQATPESYYEEIPDRLGIIEEDVAALKRLGILVDRDDKGYMLQIFTKPLQDRPTLFFEIIQRKGSTSFGKGNFKALFESIERDQAARGNL
ncbi:MAG: 4-hydroxyphenylpyruvate dioxygenase [Candidatus Sericytochromatia bacterium]|uniref:4-hydroxyphenylpyruvate dioxygenase n=1 Tax=Candidatus Tanganyikabacteria bacterium TaxID=2961651 RepID=A0A938BJ44_9BACT|nr:4-hydroxyphenylpyruvate dioxygenase [Candidatus Tanganyikabacteria bacterium]